jgi:hypothetical protein
MKATEFILRSARLRLLGAAAMLLTQAACVAQFTPQTASPIDQATSAAGLKICSSQPLKTLSPGATSGTSYVIAADCDDKAHQTVVIAEMYGSQDARDRAIRSYIITVPGRAGQKNGLLTIGNTVITIPGPRDDAAFALLQRRLRQQGAQ